MYWPVIDCQGNKCCRICDRVVHFRRHGCKSNVKKSRLKDIMTSVMWKPKHLLQGRRNDPGWQHMIRQRTVPVSQRLSVWARSRRQHRWQPQTRRLDVCSFDATISSRGGGARSGQGPSGKPSTCCRRSNTSLLLFAIRSCVSLFSCLLYVIFAQKL